VQYLTANSSRQQGFITARVLLHRWSRSK